ncbi:MAG: phytanoyl-CoA dioxygenase family protein [Azospirillaceae bacterium]|nr:phytanoyl-CoA dioxygenase family protein [Azospirillaceae bacterium]
MSPETTRPETPAGAIDCPFFFEQGYMVCRDVIAPASVDRVARFLRDEMARLRNAGPETAQDSQIQSGHFPLAARLSPALWDIPRDPTLRSLLLSALNSPDLLMHMPPTARFVDPGHAPAAVPPHQDVSYNHHLSDFLTCWVPLVDIDADCGGVAVYEGTQSTTELLNDFSRELWLRPVDADPATRVVCQPMRPGDVLLLNRWIVHESVPNRSSRTRLSIDFRFFGAGSHSTKHHLDCQTWTVIAPKG